MISDKAHADPVFDVGRQIVTNINIIETANIDAIKAWGTSPDITRVNPTKRAAKNQRLIS
jgi:hypothetical protein